MGNQWSTSDVPSQFVRSPKLGKPCLEGGASDSRHTHLIRITLGVGHWRELSLRSTAAAERHALSRGEKVRIWKCRHGKTSSNKFIIPAWTLTASSLFLATVNGRRTAAELMPTFVLSWMVFIVLRLCYTCVEGRRLHLPHHGGRSCPSPAALAVWIPS